MNKCFADWLLLAGGIALVIVMLLADTSQWPSWGLTPPM